MSPTSPELLVGQRPLSVPTEIRTAHEERSAGRGHRRTVACCAIAAIVSVAALLGQSMAGPLKLGRHWMLLAGGYGEGKPNDDVWPFVWYHPMVPAAAYSLLALAAVVLFLEIKRPQGRLPRLVAAGAAIAVFAWSLIKSIAVVRATQRQGDMLMSPVAELSLMAVAAAVCFVLANRKEKFFEIAGVLCSAVIVLNTITVLSYFTSLPFWLSPKQPDRPAFKIFPLLYGEYGDKGEWASQSLLLNPVALTASIGYLCLGLALVYHIGSRHLPLRLARGSSASALILRCMPLAIFVYALFLGTQIFVTRHFAQASLQYELTRALGSFICPGLIVTVVAWSAGRAINRAEMKRERAMEELAVAKTAAEKASRVKGEFLANMSHELRTPLTIIKLQVEALQEDAEDAGDKELLSALKTILDASQRQRALIDDILDLGKIEAGKLSITAETFDLAALLHEVATYFQPLAARKHNLLRVQANDQAGSMYTDRIRLRQCLDNLLSNACKFTENGTITLRLERDAANDRILFRISDTGCGMSAQGMEHLFQPFVQTDNSVGRRFGGTGLGLAITSQLCRLMGGTVSATSEKDIGSTFTIELPARAAAAALEPDPTRQKPRESAPTSDGRRTILTIDDELPVRELLARFLTTKGFHVVTASNGEEGLRLAKQLHPDAVTLDVLMPDMDGWTVLAALKADPALAGIPVIMLTIVDDKSQGYTLGAADFICKPIDRDHLLNVLMTQCGVQVSGTCLLVDDDPQLRRLVRHDIESEGWSVTEASNGREALELAAKIHPDVILVDLLMPVMDGFEFIQELRRNENGRAIPVVVLTAKDLTAEDRKRLNGKVDRILNKDAYSCDALLQQVAQLLNAEDLSKIKQPEFKLSVK